jgi:putative ABC transport system substrate-binding protein
VTGLRRREAIGGLTAAALLAPLPLHAQPKLPVVGFLVPGTEESHGKLVAAFAAHLAELGWIDGRTVALAYRWAAGHAERYAEIAAELVQLKADVIVTSGVLPTIVQAAPNTPIVTPVLNTGSPFIASLSHPGGMVTGLSQLGWELGGKRFELLVNVVPELRHLAVLAVETDTKRIPETAELTAAAAKRGIEIMPIVVRQADDIESVLRSATVRVEALYVVSDPLLAINRAAITTVTLEARLPTMHGVSDFVASGGLMSYGVNFQDSFRRAADYVDKILRGMKPGELPVAQPTKFDLTINLKTAGALGLSIPQTLLATADEVIE